MRQGGWFLPAPLVFVSEFVLPVRVSAAGNPGINGKRPPAKGVRKTRCQAALAVRESFPAILHHNTAGQATPCRPPRNPGRQMPGPCCLVGPLPRTPRNRHAGGWPGGIRTGRILSETIVSAAFRPMLWAGPLLCVRAKPCGLRFRKEAESAEKARKPAKIKSSFGCSCLDNKSGCYPYGKDSSRFCSENIATQKEQHPKRCCPWCGRGDSASRALKTVRRTVFARRDAGGGHRLFESSPCNVPHNFIRNK